MAITLEDIGQEICEPVAGVANKVYYALHSDFDAIVDPPDICGDVTASTFAELVEIPSPGHTLKTGARMWQVDIIEETGSVKSTMIGEKKRRLFENEIVVQIAGSSSELLGFLRWIKNQSLLFFIEEFGSGAIRQIGSKRLPAYADGIEQAIEAALEGNNSATITLKDKQKWPAAVYKGDIVLTPVA